MNGRGAPRLARGCRLGEGAVLLMPEGIIKLSVSGLAILNLCDGKRSVSELVRELQARYSPDQHVRIEAEVREFLAKLAERKAIEL